MFKFLLRPLGKTLFENFKTNKKMAGSTVAWGTGDDYAYTNVKKLGKTLLMHLGEKGELYSAYYPKKKELLLSVVFSFERYSEEGKLLDDCLDNLADDGVDNPGIFDIHEIEFVEITDSPVTEVIFRVFEVSKKDLSIASDHLYSHILDWLDIVYDDFCEEFGED